MVGMTGGVTDRGAMRRAHDRRYDRKLARPPGMSVAGKSRHAEHGMLGAAAFCGLKSAGLGAVSVGWLPDAQPATKAQARTGPTSLFIDPLTLPKAVSDCCRAAQIADRALNFAAAINGVSFFIALPSLFVRTKPAASGTRLPRATSRIPSTPMKLNAHNLKLNAHNPAFQKKLRMHADLFFRSSFFV